MAEPTTPSEPWNLTGTQRRQFREAQAAAKADESVILTDRQATEMLAEYDRLVAERDAAAARMRAINDALFASGEAKFRANPPPWAPR